MPAASPACGASSISPRSTTCARPATDRWTSRPWPWAPTSTSISGSPISASRNSPATPRRRTRCSRTPGRRTGGYLQPGEAPGHGVDIDEEAGRQIPLRARLSAGRPARGRHPLATGEQYMKITAVRPYPVWVGHRNQLLVKVETDEGMYGWGESGLSRPREGGGRRRRALREVPHRPGPDRRSARIWQEMYRSQYFEGGRVLQAAHLGHRHRAARHQGQGARRAGLSSCSAASSATASRPSPRPAHRAAATR